MNLDELKFKKIAVLGLGINNRKLAEYLKTHNVDFELIANWQRPEELTSKIDYFDVVFRTPGLPYNSPAIQQAKVEGALIYSQTKLFFDLCPAKIIGVTGSKGKGTTATLINNILKEAGFKVHLAGNIGKDPFEFLDELRQDDFVILELSSFQLQDLHKSPHFAVVLKITPEHLDHHADVKEYYEAKKPIVYYQTSDDFAVINYDNEISRGFAEITKASTVWVSTTQKIKPGCYVDEGRIILDWRGEAEEVMKAAELQLVGRFNLENVAAAIAGARACGVKNLKAMKKAVSEFSGLPHRLEFVQVVHGVKYFNDSASTNPQTVMAALNAFAEPIILIVGGAEKNLDYRVLGKAIAATKVTALLPIGRVGLQVAKLAREEGYQGKIIDEDFYSMEKIVKTANEIARAGDVVLLSPGAASFDMFKDYKHRGELFKKFVAQL